MGEKKKSQKPGKPTKDPKNVTKKAGGGGMNRIPSIISAAILACSMIYVFYKQPNTLTAQPYLPLVYPECCTGTEDQLARLWGSYRPQVYFGIRPRIPESVIFGLAWMPVMGPHGQASLRHTSEQRELKSFMWQRHDGNKFGVQKLVDNGYELETSFVKANYALQDWTARVKVKGVNSPGTERPKAISLFWYIGVEHRNSKLMMSAIPNGYSIYGETLELGKFNIKYKTVLENQPILYSALHCGTDVPLHLISDYIKHHMTMSGNIRGGRLFGIKSSKTQCSEQSNFVVMQLTLALDSEVEVVYENLNINRQRETLEGSHYESVLAEYSAEFDKKFEQKFGLKDKGYSESYIGFARSTFSNLIGGIGYFHGQSIVKESEDSEPVYYNPSSLYSAVPSRSFFPRGFLWDEGFHQLLIGKWDHTISLEVIGHWLNLMNARGWIPREQILGNEALTKVPPEFVVQNAEYANPPTLFLSLDSLVTDMQPSEILDHHSTLKKMFHRMAFWYNWYNTTQSGPLPTTYRWRGRNGTTDKELNPKTLTSGLDDYPRATHPTESEYHVDLRCWMAFASRSLANLGDLLGINVDQYRETYELLANNTRLKELHWTGKFFADYGLHSDVVGLTDKHTGQGHTEKRRVVGKLPLYQHVKVQGYVNLFPFILTLLEPSSAELGTILKNLKTQSNGMWSQFGLCSVAKSDSYYLKHNTQHDAPYWRGPVWININFLAVRALDHYSKVVGPHQELAGALYKELRDNIVNNMYLEYKRTGYIWEQYNCQTGRGQSVHPFTGWSSLVVLMMGEQY
eukprot:sb/3462214/